MSLLSGRKAYLPLEADTQYKVVLTGWIEQENKNIEANPNVLGNIRFQFTLTADGRQLSDMRSVPQGTDILARQLLIQLGDTSLNAMEQSDLFHKLAREQTVLNMWVTHKESDGTTYTNYTYLPPIVKNLQSPTAIKEEEEDFK